MTKNINNNKKNAQKTVKDFKSTQKKGKGISSSKRQYTAHKKSSEMWKSLSNFEGDFISFNDKNTICAIQELDEKGLRENVKKNILTHSLLLFLFGLLVSLVFNWKFLKRVQILSIWEALLKTCKNVVSVWKTFYKNVKESFINADIHKSKTENFGPTFLNLKFSEITFCALIFVVHPQNLLAFTICWSKTVLSSDIFVK